MAAQRVHVLGRAFLAKVLPLAAVLVLGACGNSAEDKLYEGFKCARVAQQLGRPSLASNAMQNVREHAKELESGMSVSERARSARKASERFQDDVPLHRLNNQGKYELLTEIFESGTCKKLYASPSRP